jgi:glutaredoxin 3
VIYIYGKDACPYTEAAVEDHEQRGVDFKYVNVKQDAAALGTMLKLTRGERRVPVIVDGDSITIGFAGGT